jgi:DNA mismatch repair protein MutH
MTSRQCDDESDIYILCNQLYNTGRVIPLENTEIKNLWEEPEKQKQAHKKREYEEEMEYLFIGYNIVIVILIGVVFYFGLS